jgi:hypothetical protein
MPIITLLTDFGSKDYFVGAMKGAILSINPGANIVDITHEIPPQDIRSAAFNLLATYRDFPVDTIHVAVVDPGVGSDRKPILIECANQFFVGPDNGIFSWVLEREKSFRAIHLTNDKFFRESSRTFHGRDIFAPVAAALSTGIPPQEFGVEIRELIELEPLKPLKIDQATTEARIVHIDHFGNCITNLTRFDLGPNGFDGAKLIANGYEISSLREFFADSGARPDELFCVLGSAGFLEIAAQDSSAATILGAQRGQPVVLVRSS